MDAGSQLLQSNLTMTCIKYCQQYAVSRCTSARSTRLQHTAVEGKYQHAAVTRAVSTLQLNVQERHCKRTGHSDRSSCSLR
jgi:hypothetical protein